MLRTDGRTRAGFTLIELLVVVTIIGILAAILVVAVYRAVVTATAAARKAEVKGLETAIETTAITQGTGRMYPPDFTVPARVRAYVFKRFPRIDPQEATNVMNLGLNPAQALVFWLRGTSSNPEYPFSGPGGPMDTNTLPTASSDFDFEASQLRPDPANASSRYYVYFPRGANAPFVYFASRPGLTPAYGGSYTAGATTGVAVPYQKDPVNNQPQGFVNPQSFQIVSAGADGDYGSTANRFYPSLNPSLSGGPTTADEDNVTNFSRESTLVGDRP